MNSEKVNLFEVPLTKEEQYDLSDFLDGYTQWFENYFDEDDPNNDFHGDLIALYKMVKLLENRIL